MADISMAGVGGVFPVTMHGKVVAGFTYLPNMALTLTGSNEIGPGVAGGSAVFGIVTKVEIDTKDADGKPTDIVLGVQTSGFAEGVRMTDVTANQPVFNTIASCNDKGEIVKVPATAPAAYRGIVTAVDTTTNTATIAL